MSYLAPIHRPTCVRHAVKLELLRPNEVILLEKIRPVSSQTDQIFIGTDRNMYFTVSWDAVNHRLRTEKSIFDQVDNASRESELQNRCLVDPLGCYMALLLYEGTVTFLPLSSKPNRKNAAIPGTPGEPLPARISDWFVRSCAFLHPREKDKEQFKLAILFEDLRQKVCMSVRALDYHAAAGAHPDRVELENVLVARDDIELGASHLIPVAAPAYGVLVLAETTISYFEDLDGDPLTEPLEEAAQFVAWTPVEKFRWLLGDDYGKLYLLMLLLERNGEVSGWKLDKIGQTSRASVLVYLHDGYIFVGSSQGDSQVARIHDGGLEVVQTISNIAPVLDFTVMDMGSRSGEGQTSEYSSGQARIVTGSGVFGDGSLRSVRSGVGLEEQGILGELDHATDLFALRSRPSSQYDDILVISFVNETRVFHFGADGDIEEQTDFKSLMLSEATLLLASLANGRIVQVTHSAARLIESENAMVVSEWADQAGQPITAASANNNCLVLAIGGQAVVTFQINEELKFNARQQFDEENQVSCVHMSNVDPGTCYIGFWQGSSIRMADVATLQSWRKFVMSDDPFSVPRSILLIQLLAGEKPTLIVAMANGEVITFSVDLESRLLSSKKVTVLGTQQANLRAIPRQDEVSSVFATCEHPSLIYGSGGYIVYSAVTAENATSVCAFNSELCPGAIAVATPEDVRIASVDTERTTHVQTLHVGELVRRIAYSPSLKAFGIGTIHRSLSGTIETVRSRFRLVDEVLFKELDTFDLNEEELVESAIRADISEDSGDLVERFVVGTTYKDEEQGEVKGRILVFAVTRERTLRLITALPVNGACRALGCIDGNIVAALMRTVVIYALRSAHLQKLCAYRTPTHPVDIAIHAPTNKIAIADVMKSISVATYIPPSSTDPKSTTYKLVETARHFQTAWCTAVAHVGEDTWLTSESEGNLMVLYQDTNALSADDRYRLRVVSEIRLGEIVNRIRPLSIQTPLSAPVLPKAVIATVEGGVYFVGFIGPAYLDLLMRLQSALAPLVESLGHVPFNSYRAFRNKVREEEEPERFVDGELVESFLELDARAQEKIVKNLGRVAAEKGGVDGVKELLERLRRLH
ncbi:MAG: hypothetical protein Q9163_002817 [Psora crenata]